MAEKLKVTLVKSPIGAIPKQKATVEALGLKKLNKGRKHLGAEGNTEQEHDDSCYNAHGRNGGIAVRGRALV